MLTPEELTRFTPFDALSEDYLEQVMEHAEVIDAAKGKLLFKRGKDVGHRYYLIEGSVDLVDNDWRVEHISGEMDRCSLPLTETSPTQVSAVAKSDSRFLKVEAEFLDIAMAWCESSHMMDADGDDEPTSFETHMPEQSLVYQKIEMEEEGGDWMSALLQSPLFTKVPPAHIQQLFGRFEAEEMHAGQVVVKEGLPGEFFYVIESGSVKIASQSGSVDVVLDAGHYFGEEALVGETTRNATVTMLTDGVLMKLGKEDFLTLLKEPILKHVTIESIQQLDTQTEVQLIDVRLPMEYRHHHVPECRNIPLGALRKRFAELSNEQTYVVTDDGGRRSEVAVHLLTQAGFSAALLEGAEKLYVSL